MSESAEYKNCPFCDEQIRKKAITCKYCKERLSELSEETSTSKLGPSFFEKQISSQAKIKEIRDKEDETVVPKANLSSLSESIPRRKSSANIWIVSSALLAGCFVAAYALYENVGYQFFPDNQKADEYFRKGNDLYFEHKPDLAVDEYRQAEKFSPNRSDIRYRLGWALVKSGKPFEAAAQMQKASELAPQDLELQKNYGTFLEECEEYEKAAQQFERLAKKDFKDVFCWSKAAADYRQAGKSEKAIGLYKEFLVHNPNSENVWGQLAGVYDNADASIDVLRNALKQLPKSVGLHYQLGMMLAQAQKREEAANELRLVASLDPNSQKEVSQIIADLGVVKLASFLVPLDQIKSSLYVEAVINDKRRIKLLVDSGAESCVINSYLANQLKLRPSDAQRITIATVVGEDNAHKIKLMSLAVGRAKERNVETLIYDYDAQNGEDGILGMSFLRNFNFSVDTKRKMLELKPKNTQLP